MFMMLMNVIELFEVAITNPTGIGFVKFLHRNTTFKINHNLQKLIWKT